MVVAVERGKSVRFNGLSLTYEEVDTGHIAATLSMEEARKLPLGKETEWLGMPALMTAVALLRTILTDVVVTPIVVKMDCTQMTMFVVKDRPTGRIALCAPLRDDDAGDPTMECDCTRYDFPHMVSDHEIA